MADTDRPRVIIGGSSDEFVEMAGCKEIRKITCASHIVSGLSVHGKLFASSHMLATPLLLFRLCSGRLQSKPPPRVLPQRRLHSDAQTQPVLLRPR